MDKRKVLFYVFLVLSIAINVFIVVEGAVGGNESASQSAGLTQAFIEFVRKINPNSPIVTDPETTHAVIRKLVGHFGLFGVSGIITTIYFLLMKDALANKKKKVIVFSLATGLTVAFISELVQYYTPGRWFSLTDVGIDFSGYVLFGGITFLIFYLVYRHKEKKE